MISGSWFIDAITRALLDVIWDILIAGPLAIIQAFNSIFNYLSGTFIQQLLFKQTNSFSWSSIPAAFWGFAIFAAVVICFIFWTQFIGLLFTETKEMKNKFVNSLKMTALGTITIFFIPIGFFMLNQVIIFFTANVNNIFDMPKNTNLADYLWHLGDATWDGKNAFTNTYSAPDNILDYNMVIEIFAVWFILITMGLVAMILIQKNLELFFLFIISPLVAASMANDHGKRMNTWKDMVIAKSIATSATIVSYYTFMLALALIYNLDLSQFSWIERQILLVALICGGALACYNSSTIVASLVSESSGMREGLSSLTSMAAMATGVGAFFGMKRRRSNRFNQGGYGGGNNQNPNNPNDPNAPEEDFKVPHTGLSERSGALGFLGDAISHGANALYSFAKPVTDYYTGENFENDSALTNAAKMTGKVLFSPLKNAALSPFKTVIKNTGVLKQRHAHEQRKIAAAREQAKAQKITIGGE